MSYNVKVASFEGPFDLILYFIQRDELDIYDIPITQLTNEFLTYIRKMESMDIELASEFMLVAATLMRIKAKTLLPRKEIDEFGVEIDPRQELVDKIIEYKKYKAVIEDLAQLAEMQAKKYVRGNVKSETIDIYGQFSKELEMESLSLYRLMSSFKKAVEKMEKRNLRLNHTVLRFPYTILEQKKWLLEQLKIGRQLNFENVWMICRDRVEAVFRFLAVLELIQAKGIEIQLGLGINNLWLHPGPSLVNLHQKLLKEKAENEI